MKKRIIISHPQVSAVFKRDCCETIDRILETTMREGKIHIPLALSRCIEECVSHGVPLHELTFGSKICYENTSVTVNKLRQLISFLFDVVVKEPTEVFANAQETLE